MTPAGDGTDCTGGSVKRCVPLERARRTHRAVTLVAEVRGRRSFAACLRRGVLVATRTSQNYKVRVPREGRATATLLLAVPRPGADLYVVFGISSEQVFGLAGETNTRLNFCIQSVLSMYRVPYI